MASSLPDALIAMELFHAGPCQYTLRKLPGQDNEIPNDFLLICVAPEAKRRSGEEMALVLALPLLWTNFDDEKLKLSSAPEEGKCKASCSVTSFPPRQDH